MSDLEKKSKKKKPKKSKAKKNKVEKKEAVENGDVLERVMEGIEMAGASLDFFEGAGEQAIEPKEESAVLGEAMTDAEAAEEMIDEMAASTEESSEIAMEDLEEGENGELFEDDVPEGVDFMEQKQAFSIIESLLFSSDRPLGLGTFKAVFKGTTFKSKEIKNALEEMQSVYADPSRGVSLEEINGGWQLRTKVDNMDFLRKLAKARPFKLSGPALEVLAIIAYKQPLIKAEVDEIRGVESGHLVRALMEKNLVSFQGKSELPGKPMQYGTTRKFLEIFGLRNLRELPSLDEIDQLIPEGMGFEEEEEKLSDVTASLSEDYQGNYSEGEEELVKIEDTLGGIDTSSEFFEEEKRRQKEKRDRDRAQDIREAMDVGEEVEAKDVKWLQRYDEKLAALAAEAEAAMHREEAVADEDSAAIEASADTEVEVQEFRDSLAELSSENIVSAEAMALDEEMEMADQDTESFEENTEVAEETEDVSTFDPFSDDDEDTDIIEE